MSKRKSMKNKNIEKENNNTSAKDRVPKIFPQPGIAPRLVHIVCSASVDSFCCQFLHRASPGTFPILIRSGACKKSGTKTLTGQHGTCFRDHHIMSFANPTEKFGPKLLEPP
eukprot:3474110-Amphidinium_carterae.1